MKLLSLILPGFGGITPPPGVPSGGLFPKGQSIIQVIITTFLIIVVLLALIYMIWGGVRMILSRGDKRKIEIGRASCRERVCQYV